LGEGRETGTEQLSTKKETYKQNPSTINPQLSATAKGLPSRPDQVGTASDPQPRIDFALRQANRQLGTQDLLALLRTEAPRFYDLSSKKNFWCYVGKGFARDAAVVGACDRLLSLLRNKIPENPGFDLT
jgi:hypothetical protein